LAIRQQYANAAIADDLPEDLPLDRAKQLLAFPSRARPRLGGREAKPISAAMRRHFYRGNLTNQLPASFYASQKSS